jgi:vacuolar-type H+-ATPase subunit C/Vma6
MTWDAVNARARGLATRLLDGGTVRRLVEARSWAEFLRAAADAGYAAGDGAGVPGPAAFCRFVGRVQARRLALLGRWLGRQREVLAVVYEDETRRAIRVLLRGSAEGSAAPTRVAGVTPTPDLPGRMVERLAHAGSPAELVALLRRAGHPAGRALQEEVDSGRRLGLLGLEAALGRTFAVRATRQARRGGRLVRAFTRDLLDIENAWTLLTVATWGSEVQARDLCLSGGGVLTLEECERISRLDPEQIPGELARRFAGTPLAGVFDRPPAERRAFEARALAAGIRNLRHQARVAPLGPAPVLSVMQRIRAEAHNLRAVATGLALGAPVPVIAAEMVAV